MNISFRTIRNLGLGFLLLIIVLVSVFSYLIMRKTADSLFFIINNESVKQDQWRRLSEIVSESKAYLYDYIKGEREVVSPVLLDLEKASHVLSEMKNNIKLVDKRQSEIIDEVLESVKVFKQSVFTLQSEYKKGDRESLSAREMKKLAIDSANIASQLVWQAYDYMSRDVESRNRSIIAKTAIYKNVLKVISVFAIIITLITAFIMNKALARPIRDLKTAVKRVAEGNLSLDMPVSSKDEFEDLFNSFKQMIIDLRNARAELVDKNYMDSIVASMNDGLIAIDTQFKIEKVNKAMLSMSGYAEKELINRQIETIFAENNMVSSDELVSILKNGGSSRGERNIKTRNGDIVPVYISLSARKEKSGKSAGIILNMKDITEQKKAEEKIIHAANEWRRTFDSISDLIWIHDIDFKFIRVNKALSNLLNVEPKELVGKNCFEFFQKDDKFPSDNCSDRKTWEIAKPYAEEIHKKLSGVYYQITTSPLINEYGEFRGVVHIAKDVTEQKKLNDIFFESEKLATIGTLVAEISHEINNPLQIIINHAQLVLMEESQNLEEIRESFKIIINEGARATDIMARLLKFAKPSIGEVKDVDVNESLTEVIKLIEHQYMIINVNINKQFDPQLPRVKINSRQIQEIILNLMNNARDAMPKGGDITIYTEKEGNNIKITVEDTGGGMSEQTAKRIFEPFFTTKEKGTGLGLPICRSLITAHHGELKLESELGKGTKAIILLPI